MIYFSKFAPRSGFLAATLFVLVTVLVFVATAGAVDLDFNVANGNYNVANNWIDQGNPGDPNAVPPIPPTAPAPPAAPPGTSDVAWVRNNGTVNITSNVSPLDFRIGGDKIDPFTQAQVGMPGTVNWTAGEITGLETQIGATNFYTGGPSLKIGRFVGGIDYPGTVVQNGAGTQIMLRRPQSRITIGDAGTTANPTSSYTLMNGTIGLAVGTESGVQGANGNSGIHVRNGFFTMTGGQIIDASQAEILADPKAERFLTVGDRTGVLGSETRATATFTGGNVDVLGSIRLAPSANTRGYLNINGPVTIQTGGDTEIGHNANNGVGEMNMSAGSLTVGRTAYALGQTGGDILGGKLVVGNRGPGFLNMSGGTITVTEETRVGAELGAGGSILTMTGGTITTPQLLIGIEDDEDSSAGYLGASVIIDGPSAVFTQTPNALSGGSGTIIGKQGAGLFEVRQGHATLGGGGTPTQLAYNPTSQATLNVTGGKLTLSGRVTKANAIAATPVVGLTGGILEFNQAVPTQIWEVDFTNAGSQLVLKQDALFPVQIGSVSPSIPADFAMTSGSWNLEIGSGTLGGADWFNVPNGTAELTGGTLNLSYINGYTPADGHTIRILRGANGVTLDSGAVTIAGANAANWELVTDALNTEIRLKYSASVAVTGDHNGDGDVTALDYVVWRSNPATSGGPDGYDDWRENYGEPNGSGSGSTSAVPEPTSIGLLMVALGTFFAASGKRHRTR